MARELTISITEFKSRCLRLIDEVSRRKVRLVVTKRGKPVARILPPDTAPPEVHGCLEGTVEVGGDLTEPTGIPWDALNGR